MNSKEKKKGEGGDWGKKRERGEERKKEIKEDAKQTIIRLNRNCYWKYGSGSKRIN